MVGDVLEVIPEPQFVKPVAPGPKSVETGTDAEYSSESFLVEQCQWKRKKSKA